MDEDFHDGPHAPSAMDGDDWQESLAFQFYDPRKRIGGYFHVGLQRLIDRADIWSWIAVEGRKVHNFQHLDLRLPTQDFPDFRLGPLGVRSTEAMVGRKVTVADGDVALDIDYRAFAAPVSYGNHDAGSGNFAKGHVETVGRVAGSLRIGGETLAIAGWAFDDRSWGERDWTKLLTFRFLWASFGEDLHLAVYLPTSPGGSTCFGFLTDRGVRHDVIDIDLNVHVAGNGVYARGLDAVIWTRDGGGYRLTGEADGNLVVTQRHGYMGSPALIRMEMNGRVGGGVLELCELKRPTPQLIAEFGLMPHPADGERAS